MSQTQIYQILKELGGVNVTIQAICARLREKYPNDRYLAERASLKLYRLNRGGIVTRDWRPGRRGGYTYTIIRDYE